MMIDWCRCCCWWWWSWWCSPPWRAASSPPWSNKHQDRCWNLDKRVDDGLKMDLWKGIYSKRWILKTAFMDKRWIFERATLVKGVYWINIAKGTMDPRVEFISQDHSSQFTNLEHKTISESRLNIKFKISTKHQHLDLILKSWPNLASETWQRFNFVTSTKHQQQNNDQTSVSKSRLNFNFKILIKSCAQSLNKTSASKSATNCSYQDPHHQQRQQ